MLEKYLETRMPNIIDCNLKLIYPNLLLIIFKVLVDYQMNNYSQTLKDIQVSLLCILILIIEVNLH